MPIKRSTYGYFCTFLFLILITLKITVGLPITTFTIFGIGYLGLLDTLYVRFRLKEKGKLDTVSFGIGALIILWTLAEVLWPH
jgi:hypothetical protein